MTVAASAQPGLRRWVAADRKAGRVGRRLALGALLLLALAVRLHEPLSSPILAAEDPYLHMVKAYDIIQGHGLPRDYPPGFAVLLAPFAILGPAAFTAVARFLPPFLGVAEVLGVYLLCREHLRTPAALVAATLVALMPENVFRTDILFPTALDLAVLPWYLWLLMRAGGGDRRALVGAVAIVLALAFVHPWVLVYMAAPALVVAIAALRSPEHRVYGLVALGALAVAGTVFLFLPAAWNPAPEFAKHAGPKLAQILRDPRALSKLPPFVDLPAMVTWPVLAIAAVGAATAIVRRTRLGLVALAFTLAILPFVLVDWFDVWFIPHRSVAYLSLGLAILAALPIEMMGALPEWELADVAAATVIAAMALVVILPSAIAVQPWYRLYDADDQHAWQALDARDPPLVVTGSWQGAVGYRAMTGHDAVYNPRFFRDAATRDHDSSATPGMVVLVDAHARAAHVDTSWLGGWKKIGQWGDVAAYAR